MDPSSCMNIEELCSLMDSIGPHNKEYYFHKTVYCIHRYNNIAVNKDTHTHYIDSWMSYSLQDIENFAACKLVHSKLCQKGIVCFEPQCTDLKQSYTLVQQDMARIDQNSSSFQVWVLQDRIALLGRVLQAVIRSHLVFLPQLIIFKTISIKIPVFTVCIFITHSIFKKAVLALSKTCAKFYVYWLLLILKVFL